MRDKQVMGLEGGEEAASGQCRRREGGFLLCREICMGDFLGYVWS